MKLEAVLPSVLLSHRRDCSARPARRTRTGTAFTLIELLVTMTVGTLLIVFLFQLFGASMRAWRQGEDQVETYREARAALQMMVRDLSQTVQPITASAYPSPSPTATPTPGASPTVMTPVLVLDHFDDTQAGSINEEVYCLTTIPNNGASGLCAVGYFCAWKPDLYPPGSDQQTHAPHAYSLMRQYLGSGAPMVGTGTPVPGLYDRFQQYSGASPLTFPQVFDRAVPPATPSSNPPQATATELASYIWDLQIRTSDTLQNTTSNRYKKQSPYPNLLPTYVEVRFKALSESAARQLEGNGSVVTSTWNDSNDANSIYQRIILPGTRQFSARVPIYSGSATPTPTP